VTVSHRMGVRDAVERNDEDAGADALRVGCQGRAVRDAEQALREQPKSPVMRIVREGSTIPGASGHRVGWSPTCRCRGALWQSRQGVAPGRAGDKTHHGVSPGHDTDIGRCVCEDGCNARRENHPLRVHSRDQVIPRRADDRHRTARHRQAAPAEPPCHPPGDELDRRARDGKPEIQQRQEVWRRGKWYSQPPQGFAQSDHAQNH
jgi:hypothetical protein